MSLSRRRSNAGRPRHGTIAYLAFQEEARHAGNGPSMPRRQWPTGRPGRLRPSRRPTCPLDDPSLYINRELSWLEFNRRVLEEAQDPTVPLLERLKFLAIFSSNLDEFFMVRVGGLQQKVPAGIARGSGADRMPPQGTTRADQHDRPPDGRRAIPLPAHRRAARPGARGHRLPRRQGPDRRRPASSSATSFSREVFPVLTPLAIDPGHPFPHLLNKSLNLAVLLQRPRDDEQLFAVVQVPAVLPRFVPLPDRKGPRLHAAGNRHPPAPAASCSPA